MFNRSLKTLVALSTVTALMTVGQVSLIWGSAQAKTEWAVALRSDDEIRDFVGKLKTLLADEPQSQQHGATVLADAVMLEAKRNEYRRSENHTLYLYDESDESAATQELILPPGAELRTAKAWVLRSNGKLERLKEEAVRIQKSQKDKAGSVVIAFPSLSAGDSFGWSTTVRRVFRLGSAHIYLTGDLPVKYSQIYVRSDATLTYEVIPENLTDDRYTFKILQRAHGAPSLVKFTIRDLPARTKEPFALPVLEREPFVVVAFHGEYVGDYRQWIYEKSWHRAALSIETLLADWTTPTDELREEAKRIMNGVATTAEKASRLHRFVRDEVLTVASSELDDRYRSAEDILRDRTATRFEKGMLLTALLKSADLPCHYVLARNRDLGPIEHRNPGLWQFTDLLCVVTADGMERWYCPATAGCPPNELPPTLRHAEACRIENDLSKRNDKVWKEVAKYAQGSPPPSWVAWYFEILKREKWYKFMHTPGDPSSLAGVTREVLSFSGEPGRVSLELSSSGMTPLAELSREETDPKGCVSRYLEDRLDGIELSEAGAVEDDRSTDGAVRMEAQINALALRPPTGDTWVLPGGQIFGSGPLADWGGVDRGPFYVDATREYQYQCRVPLPDGWEGIAPMESIQENGDRLEYRVAVHAEDDVIVIDRRLRLLAGTTPVDGLEDLSRTIDMILDFEQSPLVLTAASGSR